ncbi:MAG TPA: MerR family transcriptional regulator [Acidimicrobiales bacterium]|nr:MerR family transcriptional regulator [Acidimicrobiales bacterium]
MSTLTTEGRLLRIGEMAERTGVSERTLRYYEEIGLLVPAGHSPGGSRRYGMAQVARVTRIRELQQLLGLNLEEIRTVLSAEDRLDALRAAWHEHEDLESRRRILAKGLEISTTLRQEVAAKLERIQAFLAQVDERLARNQQLTEELDELEAPAAKTRAPRRPRR